MGINYIPYYAVCALLWLFAWMLVLWYFQTRRTRGSLVRRLSWPQRILLIAAVVAVPVLYVHSYPLYLRLAAAFPAQRHWLGGFDDLYVPVQFLQNPAWSYEPYLYPLALLAVVLTPLVIHKGLIFARVRHPRIVGTLLVVALAMACFVFMLGPI